MALCLWLPWRLSADFVYCGANMASNRVWMARHPLQTLYLVLSSSCTAPYQLYGAPSRYGVEAALIAVAILLAIRGGIAQGRQDSLRDLLHTWRMPLVGFGVGFGIVVVTYFFMAVTWVDLATTDHVRLDATRRIPDSLSCAAASARPICLLSGKPDGVTSGDGGQPTHRMCRLRISRCDVYLCSGSWPVPAWNQFERS